VADTTYHTHRHGWWLVLPLIVFAVWLIETMILGR
jgi:hypothetical protein